MSGGINQKRRVCHGIQKFINYFPNFVKMKENNPEFRILYEVKNLKVPKKINLYLSLVTENITFEESTSEKEKKQIKYKLNEYILIKLYEKIYPKTPIEEDNIVYTNCVKYSWIQPKHFFTHKENKNYELFFDEIKKYFIQLENEKSPNKKMDIIMELSKTLKNILIFNGSSKIDSDDETEIIAYNIIKVQPKRIYSELEYIQIFTKEDGGERDHQIKLFIAACKFVKNLSDDKLKNINPNDINLKCNMALKKIGKGEDKKKKSFIINSDDDDDDDNIINENFINNDD
jgi:hypothetical protein